MPGFLLGGVNIRQLKICPMWLRCPNQKFWILDELSGNYRDKLVLGGAMESTGLIPMKT